MEGYRIKIEVSMAHPDWFGTVKKNVDILEKEGKIVRTEKFGEIYQIWVKI